MFQSRFFEVVSLPCRLTRLFNDKNVLIIIVVVYTSQYYYPVPFMLLAKSCMEVSNFWSKVESIIFMRTTQNKAAQKTTLSNGVIFPLLDFLWESATQKLVCKLLWSFYAHKYMTSCLWWQENIIPSSLYST